MPYSRYKLHIRDRNYNKPKRTLAREKKKEKDKMILIQKEFENLDLSIYQNRKKRDLMVKKKIIFVDNNYLNSVIFKTSILNSDESDFENELEFLNASENKVRLLMIK